MITPVPFCESCGIPSSDGANAFCTECGTAFVRPSERALSAPAADSGDEVGAAVTPPPYQLLPDEQQFTQPEQEHSEPPSREIEQPSPSPTPAQLPTQPPAPSAGSLFDADGQRTERFESLAREIFSKVDATTEPLNTGVWEQSKMEAFTEMCGGQLRSPYERVLRVTYQVLGCATDTVDGKKVLTPEGFVTYLEYKAQLNPDKFCGWIVDGIDSLGIDVSTIRRRHSPLQPDSVALGKKWKVAGVLSGGAPAAEAFLLRDLRGRAATALSSSLSRVRGERAERPIID